jgi:phage terminase Nu1 subunit (DNA packaging protein)
MRNHAKLALISLSVVFNMITIVAQIILAILKMYPEIRDMVFNAHIEEMKKKNAEAVNTSSKTDDQRPIEDAMNSKNSGKPSNAPGAEVITNWPDIK